MDHTQNDNTGSLPGAAAHLAAPSGYGEQVFMHACFERQAQCMPDAIAVADVHGQWTYAQLNAIANHLAQKLIALGVGPDACVGVLVGRSRMLVGVLIGILKSGGAYVPMDPDYPSERLRFMLEDTQARVLITEGAIRRRLDIPFDGVVLDIHDIVNAAPVASEPDPNVLIDSDHLACVTYTSGSTGRAKAVGVRHAAAAAFVAWSLSVFDADDLNGVLFATSVCFDLSVFEVFVPLSRGGRVIVAKNALDLPNLASRETVTLINTVPSAMAELLWQRAVPSTVRVINLAGEALPAALVRTIHARDGDVRLFNLYGPSECTTYATFARIGTEIDHEIPIGRPIDGTYCYVLDEMLEPVAGGEEGELFIGGEGVARGYLGRPALTAERFLPDPFDALGGRRMYRTGDRVYRRSDGSLVFRGRVDFQIKLRGYRIELGEIEHVLEEQPEIARAIVTVVNEGKESRLIACVVVEQDGPRPTHEELRARLRCRLPDYMVPGAWLELDRLPMTLNGKIDRAALTHMLASPARATTQTLPRNNAERAVAAIWSELLGIDTLHIDDDFFALGGHSLSASRMLVRVAREHGLELSLKNLFDAPTLAAFAAHLETGSPIDASGALPVDASPLSQTPLSYEQEMMYLEDRLHPANASYNVVESFHIQGELDLPALERALVELVRRHQSLRTRFVQHDDVLIQCVEPPGSTMLSPVLEVIDCSQDARRQDNAKQILLQSACASFSLADGPLLRAIVVKLGHDQHRLLIAVHHIATDGWSQSILRRELGELYCDFGSTPLPPLPIQYIHYAAWQRKTLGGTRLQEGLRYWSAQLSGMLGEAGFIPDRSRPSKRSFHGARETLVLGAPLVADLQRGCTQHGVTPFMWLLAVLKVLLNRYAGHDDIAIGTTFSDRRLLEAEALIGNFTNTVVLRSDLSDTPPFATLLKRVSKTTIVAHRYRDIPFQKVVEHVGRDRSRQHLPFFQVMFVLENAPKKTLQLGAGLRVSAESMDIGACMTDIALVLAEEDGRLNGYIEYCTDLFDCVTISELCDAYRTLLRVSLAEPTLPIDRLNILDEQSQRRVRTWGFGAQQGVGDITIERLIERQVSQRPDAAAVIAEVETVAYGALNARANRLARFLRVQGITAETPVGVMLERGADLYAAVLAVLKSGGVYVPLDPSYPNERLAYMAADAGLHTLIVHGRTHRLAPAGPWRVVDIDADGGAWGGLSTDDLALAPWPEQLAYIIYTSGSTGRPKGVGISHRALANQVLWAGQAFALTPSDRFLQKASISFDSSIEEMLVPLTCGACLVAARPNGEYDAGHLVDLIEGQAITCVDLTPSLLDALLIVARPDTWCHLRWMIAGGESLKPESVRAFRTHAKTALANTYGPTEATVQAAWTGDLPEDTTVPIGRPVANTQLYVLDAHLQCVPQGARGELYIGGMGLARGYLRCPGLTAERFIPDPFGNGGERLYRTGDLARWRADGQLEFLGRRDQQVKLRGYRIEPEEIERVLESHPGVRQAAVVVRADSPDGAHLAAYIVRAGESDLTTLRTWLRERVPHYMVPAAWMALDVLPLTANAKLDRARLPVPQLSLAASEYQEPRNVVERAICDILAALLKRERVGVHDKFFDLGGHSLSATQAASRMSSHFGIEVQVRTLLETPTVAAMALAVEQSLATNDGNAGVLKTTVRKSLDPQQLVANMDALSEDEVELLLELLDRQESM